MYKNPLEGTQDMFVTGPPGVGKTYAINDYMQKHPNTLLCASTGTAAVNIGGSTAHRLFYIPVPAYGADPEKITPSQLRVFADIDTIIIDEISMLRNDAFSFAMRVKQKAEKLYNKKIRVILSGDFSQLPPIVKKNEEKYFTKYGYDKSGFAFTTKEWQDLKLKVIELTDVKRQTDKEFVKQLHRLRKGDTEVINYFNEHFYVNKPKHFNDDQAITVCSTNLEAEQLNQEYLDSIDTPMAAYKAKKQGITGKELPCPDIVLLKQGCKVMFTANDTIRDIDGNFNTAFDDNNSYGRYTNGMFGTVIQTLTDSVIVKTETGDQIEVKPHKWSVYKYTVDRASANLKKEEIGSIVQIPLKVAKAITVHKSQGKTFSFMKFLPHAFAPGQLYVALSRVRSPEGLFLETPIQPEQVMLDPTVQKFYDNGYKWEIPKTQLDKQKAVAKKQQTKKTKKTTKKTIKKGTRSTKKTTKKTTSRKKATKPATKKTRSASTAKKTTSAKRSTAKRTTAKKTTKGGTAKKRTTNSAMKKRTMTHTKATIKRNPPK